MKESVNYVGYAPFILFFDCLTLEERENEKQVESE